MIVTAPHISAAFGNSVVTFATRGGMGLGAAAPPRKPPEPKRYGSYCFRATCMIEDPAQPGCPIAKIKGYDRSPQIAKDTEEVCRMHVRTMDGALVCAEAEVVLLPGTDMECSGQMMFVMDGNVRRLV